MRTPFLSIVLVSGLMLAGGCSSKPGTPPSSSPRSDAGREATTPAKTPPAEIPPVKTAPPKTKSSSATAPIRTGAITPPPVSVPGIQWSPATGTSVNEVAKKVDERLSSLQGVQAQAHYEMKIPAGTGFGDVVAKFKTPRIYFLQFPTQAKGVPQGGLAKSDGKIVLEKAGGNVRKRPIDQKGPVPNGMQIEQAWTETPGRQILSGLLDGRSPFSELATALPKQGYVLSLQKRTLNDVPNHLQYLLKAERAESAKGGKSLIEFILDGRLFLPLTFHVVSRPPGAKQESVFVWSASWRHNLTFPASDFDPKTLTR